MENDVVYTWKGNKPVSKYGDITMAQFTLDAFPHDKTVTGENHGNY